MANVKVRPTAWDEKQTETQKVPGYKILVMDLDNVDSDSEETKAVNECIANFQHSFYTSGVLEPNRFHQALIKGDQDFYNRFLSKLTDISLRTYALSTPVNWDSPGKYLQDQQTLNRDKMQSAKAGEIPRGARIPQEILVSIKCTQKEKWRAELPLTLTAISGDMSLLQKAIADGANLLAEDNKGNNVVHDLVLMSKSQPDTALNMLNALLLCSPRVQLKERLLSHKNKKGNKPLDVAARKHLPEIFLALFNTEVFTRLWSRTAFFTGTFCMMCQTTNLHIPVRFHHCIISKLSLMKT